MNDKTKIEIAQELLSDLLKKLGGEEKIHAFEGEGGRINLKIETSDPGMLIGFHGETLTALQLVFQLMLFRKTGEWLPVLLDVGDYREERREKIRELAKRGAEKARFLATPVALPPMPPAERREVHLAVSEISGLVSYSIDEGATRRVVIKPEESGQGG